MTAATPGIRHAAEGSIRRIRAWGWGERRVAPHSIPSAQASEEKAKRPCTLATASGRTGLSPIRPAPERVRRSSVVPVPGAVTVSDVLTGRNGSEWPRPRRPS